MCSNKVITKLMNFLDLQRLGVILGIQFVIVAFGAMKNKAEFFWEEPCFDVCYMIKFALLTKTMIF